MREAALAVVRPEPSGALERAFGAFSPTVLKEQVKLVQDVMREVMTDGEHYGKIPGCGDKPALLKPGAEKLGFVFRLAPEFVVDIIDHGSGHREYRVRCRLVGVNNGAFFGEGVGCCSTLESKYRWRSGEGENTGNSVPKAYWDIRKANPAKAQELLGGKGFRPKKVDGQWFIFQSNGERVENPDIADTYNTVLKMAKKRAHVDAILTATAASDIFTQDIEEMAEPVRAEVEPEPPPAPPMDEPGDGFAETQRTMAEARLDRPLPGQRPRWREADGKWRLPSMKDWVIAVDGKHYFPWVRGENGEGVHVSEATQAQLDAALNSLLDANAAAGKVTDAAAALQRSLERELAKREAK